MALKMSSVVKQLMYVLKLFRVTAASRAMFSHSRFGSIDVKKNASDHVSQVSGFGYDPRNPPGLCGFFGSIIHFCILEEKRNILFFK